MDMILVYQSPLYNLILGSNFKGRDKICYIQLLNSPVLGMWNIHV